MRRIILLIVWLYPARWRQRYRTELEALLEDLRPGWRDLFDVLKGSLQMQMAIGTIGRSIVAFGLAGAILAGTLSFALRNKYRSTGFFTVQKAEDEYWAERKDLMHKVFSRASLMGIIEKEHLYERERVSKSMDEVIEKMCRNIYIRVKSPTAFEVSFDYADAARAQQTISDLLGRLIDENIRPAGTPPTGAIFRIDRPPSMPQTPFWPNRTAVTCLGLGAGLLMGAAVALVRRPKTRE